MPVVLMFIATLAAVGGLFVGIAELDKSNARGRCERLGFAIGQEARFAEYGFATFGCAVQKGDNWIDVDSLMVSP